jgi:hypothetical protein
MYKYEKWDKKSRVNGVSASQILTKSPYFKDVTYIIRNRETNEFVYLADVTVQKLQRQLITDEQVLEAIMKELGVEHYIERVLVRSYNMTIEDIPTEYREGVANKIAEGVV